MVKLNERDINATAPLRTLISKEKGGKTAMVYKEGHGMYGHCWIEGDGARFYVCVDGKSTYGPYSSLADAMAEFSRWCA